MDMAVRLNALLKYTRGVFTLERHARGKCVCEDCETLIHALVPVQVIDKGISLAWETYAQAVMACS